MEKGRTLRDVLLLEKKRKIGGGIYHKMQVDFAYNSNHIEGSQLSHEQTRYIFETHSIDGTAFVDDVIETANHFKCFDFVLDTIDMPITEEYVKQLHRILKSGFMAEQNPEVVVGEYKKYANVVGGIITAKPADVSRQMAVLLQKYETHSALDLYDVAQFHVEFEKIHPFYDGNGRVGRLLLFKMCLANAIVPFGIDERHKMFYYMGLKEWQQEHQPNRLLDVFLSMQDDMKAVLDYFEILYPHLEQTSRELIAKHS